MPSIFSRIIVGEIPCFKIAEDDQFFAFLDVSPVAFGHTLVVPKVVIDYIFSLDNPTLSSLMLFSKKIAQALERSVPCKRIGISVIGLEVPHAHVHLLPLNSLSDTDFSRTRLNYSAAVMQDLADKIAANIL